MWRLWMRGIRPGHQPTIGEMFMASNQLDGELHAELEALAKPTIQIGGRR